MESSRVSFGSIVVGALLCIALFMLFASLASGLGLMTMSLEHGEVPRVGARWGAAIYALVALIVSFFVAGYVAARFSSQVTRSSSIWHGLGSWSLVVVSCAIVVGSMTATFGTLLLQAGVGAGAAVGAAGTVDDVAHQLSRVRIVTDMKILKGKAVTQIIVPEHGKELAGIAAKDIEKEVKGAKNSVQGAPKTKAAVSEAAGIARKALGGTSLAAFAALLIGALSAALGGLAGTRRGAMLPSNVRSVRS